MQNTIGWKSCFGICCTALAGVLCAQDFNTCSTESVKFMIGAGANVNICDEYGRTPLMCALDGGKAINIFEDTVEVIKLLLEVGVDVNAQDGYGYTAVGLMCYKSFVDSRSFGKSVDFD